MRIKNTVVKPLWNYFYCLSVFVRGKKVYRGTEGLKSTIRFFVVLWVLSRIHGPFGGGTRSDDEKMINKWFFFCNTKFRLCIIFSCTSVHTYTRNHVLPCRVYYGSSVFVYIYIYASVQKLNGKNDTMSSTREVFIHTCRCAYVF